MNHHWKELLPIDQYTVASNGILHDYDRKVITLLYQPLIGPIAMSLYMTLWAQVEENRLWSKSDTHHSLMSFMDLNLKAIHDARLKLEGIGLLKTYKKSGEDTRAFIYELQAPLTPEHFFLDGMLNIFLYQKIGKARFSRLKQFFSDTVVDHENYNDATREFQDVYDSVVPSSFENDEIENGVALAPIGREIPTSIKVHPKEDFDFELLMAGLSESLVPKKAITKKVRDAISTLSFLYGIDSISMKNLLITAIDERENVVILDVLRKAARDWYVLQHQDKLPQLIDKVQPLPQRTSVDEPKTQSERLMHYLDFTSPRQLLIDISGGGEPSNADLKIIEDVMFKQKLAPGVVNVLIQYVLLKTDMKLTKAYVDKIASHWARKKVSTVKEAMDLAISEHRQYMEWAEKKDNPKTQNRSKKQPIRTEVLPDWFDQDEEKNASSEKNTGQMDKKRALEERLKKYKK